MVTSGVNIYIEQTITITRSDGCYTNIGILKKVYYILLYIYIKY